MTSKISGTEFLELMLPNYLMKSFIKEFKYETDINVKKGL